MSVIEEVINQLMETGGENALLNMLTYYEQEGRKSELSEEAIRILKEKLFELS
jgi:hypothetical protein